MTEDQNPTTTPSPISSEEMPSDWKRIAKELSGSKDLTIEVMLKNEGAGLYRAFCQHCQKQFDMFGELTPGILGPDAPLSAVAQKILEHAEGCAGMRNPAAFTVLQNKNTPVLFKAQVEWRAA